MPRAGDLPGHGCAPGVDELHPEEQDALRLTAKSFCHNESGGGAADAALRRFLFLPNGRSLVAQLSEMHQRELPGRVLSARDLTEPRSGNLLLLPEEEDAGREGGDPDEADDEGSDRDLHARGIVAARQQQEPCRIRYMVA